MNALAVMLGKIQKAVRHAQARFRAVMPLPSRLQIEPTTRCNLCCAICPNRDLPDSRRNRDMPFTFFREIVEQVPTLKEIKLQGLGEPLLTPDLYEMLELGRSRGIRFDIITNGMLVERHVKRIMPFLSRFAVSLDGATQETVGRLRAGISVDRVKSALTAMVKEKRDTHASCVIGLTCVVSKDNAHEVEAVLRLGRELELDAVGFVAVENWRMPGEAGYEESCRFVEESLPFADMERIREMHREGGYKFQLGLQDSSPRKGDCYWTFSSVFITCDGFVTPCCVRPNPAMISFGNLQEQTFEAIWNGTKMRAFRKTHVRNLPNPVCDRCPR